MVDLSIIIPVYNEEVSIEETIEKTKKTIKNIDMKTEIIIVNDCSKDRSHEILKNIEDIIYLRHPKNKGYGASLKTGIKNAKGDLIAITDADGTYPIEELSNLIKYTKKYDMVIGARTKKGVQIPLIRRPAKWFIRKLAEYLTNNKIPDLNSGLRIFKKEMALRFWNLFPNGFSFTSTITIASMINDYSVIFIPINYYKRKGKSSIHPIKDFLGFINLIFRIVIYFKPLKFFITPGLLLLISGIILGINQITLSNNLGESSLLLIFTGIQICFLGILADMISKNRK